MGWDLSGAEWFVTGQEAAELHMIEVQEKKLDPHIHTAYLQTGVSKDYAKLEAGEMGHETDPDILAAWRKEHPVPRGVTFTPRTMTFRQAGKKCNHGLNYRLTFRGFAKQVEIPEREAKTLVNSYLYKAYPRLPAWHNSLKEEVIRNGYLENCFGRPVIFYAVFDLEGKFHYDVWNKAASYKPQSTIFDVTRVGMDKIYNSRERCFRAFEMRMQVHDEIWGTYPMDDFSAAADLTSLVAFDYLRPKLTSTSTGREYYIECESRIGPNRADMVEFKPSRDRDVLIEQIKEAWAKSCEKATTRLD